MQEKVELPSGLVIDDFYRVVMQDFSAVVAITEKQEVVMVRCYKHGLGQVLLYVPAGNVEPGETPLETAQRELLEETGYAASEWKGLGSYVVDGNHQCGTMHLFLARHAKWVKPCPKDEKEEVQVELVGKRSIIKGLLNGEFPHLPTASAIALSLVFDKQDER